LSQTLFQSRAGDFTAAAAQKNRIRGKARRKNTCAKAEFKPRRRHGAGALAAGKTNR